jgi:hypothetical protein
MTGRGSPWARGAICGIMTTLGGLGHTLPYLLPDSWSNAFWIATSLAGVVVFFELWAIAYIRTRYMDTPFLQGGVPDRPRRCDRARCRHSDRRVLRIPLGRDCHHNRASRCSSERYVMIRIVTWFTRLLVFGWACVAHASPVPPVDPLWSTDRIARLPREVRELVLFACGPHARAGHYFATYDPHLDAIHLDYSVLECPDLSRSGGGIGGLHQTFVRRARRYVLLRRQRDVRPRATGILAGLR